MTDDVKPVRRGCCRSWWARAGPSAAELTVNLQGLVLTGDLGSQGQADAACFESTSCGPGRHDGGDGWCVDMAQCSSGYRLSPDRTCAP